MYWLIEPEISSSATIGGALRARPEIFQIDHRAAGLQACAQRAAHVDEVAVPVGRQPARLHLVERQHQPLDRVLGGGDLGRRHLREILLLQHLAVGDREARVDLELRLLVASRSPLARRTAPPRRAARRACGASASRGGACGNSDGDQLVEIGALARRTGGTPDRTAANARAASRTPHAASSRNPRACRRRRLARRRAHRAPRRARPECRPRAARARNRRCSRRAGRPVGSATVTASTSAPGMPQSLAARSSRALSSSSLALVPSMRAMSSWYFSSTPSVSETVAGSSATTSSSASAVAQSSVSATPGDLNRSCLAQRLHEMHDLLATAPCRCPAPWRARSSSSRSASG